MTTLETILLFAQENKDGGGGGGGLGGLGMFLPLIIIFVLFYFLMILPQRRREKQLREQLNTLKKNDKVMTQGGIIGVVSYIGENNDEVTLRLEEGKMRVAKSAITRIFTPEQGQDADK